MPQTPGLRNTDSLPRYNSLELTLPFRGRKAVRRPLFVSRKRAYPPWLQKGGLVLLALVLSLTFLGFINSLTDSTTKAAPHSDFHTPASSRRSLLTDADYPTNYTLTIFTTPREFVGAEGEKQRAALVSWLALKPQPRVVLLGGDPGLGDVAGKYAPGVVWDNKTDTNFLGLPLFHSMLLRARAATTNVAVLLEPDMLLLPDFSAALAKARGVAGQDWLLLARRWEVRNFPFRVEQVFQEEERDFEVVGSDEGSQERGSGKRRFRWVDPSRFDAEAEHLWALEFLDGSGNGRGDGSVNRDSDGSVIGRGPEERYRGGMGGMRAFVRERGMLRNCGEVALWAWDTGNTPLHSGVMPPFIYSRGSYDEWLLHEAVSDGQRQVIDASHAISAVRVLGSIAYAQPYLGHTRVASQNGEYRDTRTAQQKAGGHDKQAASEHKLWKVGPKGVGWELALNRHLAQSYGTYGSREVNVNAPWRMGPCGQKAPELCFFKREEGSHTWAEPFEIEDCETTARNIADLETRLMSDLETKPRAESPVGLPMKLAELLPLVASPGGTVTLVVVANNYREMLMSFVCRLKSLGVQNILVGALDGEMYQYASEQGLPVFQDVFEGSISPDECHFGTQCFRDVTKLKSRTVVKVLKLGYNVLMSDVDVVWFRDPTPLMMAYGPNTFTGQSDQHNDTGPANDERRFNSGFYLARAEPTTVEALTAIAEHAATTELSEQPSFQHVLCEAEGSRKIGGDECEFKNGLRVIFLDRKMFPNGATSFIWEKQNTKEFCEQRGCIVLHNNWVKGRPYKFWREKYKGFWRYNAHYRTCQYDWMDSTNIGLY